MVVCFDFGFAILMCISGYSANGLVCCNAALFVCFWLCFVVGFTCALGLVVLNCWWLWLVGFAIDVCGWV